MSATDPTPREKHLRDVLTSVLLRLRRMAGDAQYPPDARREAGKIADFLTADIDRKGAGE
jgi:hypothetical protein